MDYTFPSQILPGLWIGDASTASNRDFFIQNDIGGVVNCTFDVPDYFIRNGVDYHRVPCDDTLKEKDFNDMTYSLPDAVRWIYQRHDKLKKNIFVHCHKGIQRSSTVVVAYLYHTRLKDLRKCIGFVIGKRPVAFFGGNSVNFISSLKRICV